MPNELTTGWAVIGADFDNDGYEDLFVNSADLITYQYPLPSWYTAQPNKWFYNNAGTGWTDRSAEVPVDAQFAEIYVMVQAEWNQDGCVDLAAMPIGTEAMLLEGEVEVDDCPADLDDSGLITVDDLLALIGAFGGQGFNCTGDIDGDGIVGANDILFALSLFGEPCPN